MSVKSIAIPKLDASVEAEVLVIGGSAVALVRDIQKATGEPADSIVIKALKQYLDKLNGAKDGAS